MRIALLACIAISCLSLAKGQSSSPGVLSSNSTTIKDSSALALGQKALAALVPSGVTYSDAAASGTLVLHGQNSDTQFPIKLEWKSPSKVLEKIQRPTGTDAYVSDGLASCTALAGQTPFANDLSDTHPRHVDYLPLPSLLSGINQADGNVQYGGSATLPDGVSDVIILSRNFIKNPGIPDLQVLTRYSIFINRNSGRISKVQFMTLPENASGIGLPTELNYSDYRSVNGAVLPFHVSKTIKGQVVSEMSFDTVLFNSGLLDSDFALSCGGAQ